MKKRSLRRAIRRNATSAQSVSSSAGSATAHSLADQIAAAHFLAADAAAGDALSALRPRKMIPPSSIGARIGRGS